MFWGFEIAMDDPVPVRDGKGARDAPAEPESAGGLPGTLLHDQVLETLSVDDLHNDVERAVVGLAEVVDGDDIGMGELRRRPGLAEEPLDDVLRGDELGSYELDGDRLVQQEVGSSEHRAHAAPLEESVDSVLPVEGPADGLFLAGDSVLQNTPVIRADPLVRSKLSSALWASPHSTMLRAGSGGIKRCLYPHPTGAGSPLRRNDPSTLRSGHPGPSSIAHTR